MLFPTFLENKIVGGGGGVFWSKLHLCKVKYGYRYECGVLCFHTFDKYLYGFVIINCQCFFSSARMKPILRLIVILL